jgi:pilus assembly protein TadC
MNKINKIILLVWAILALISFVSSFWAPLYFKIIGIAFGSLNMITIITWVLSYFVMKGNQNMLNKMIEDSNAELEKELEEEI